jgi:hypothetical protein
MMIIPIGYYVDKVHHATFEITLKSENKVSYLGNDYEYEALFAMMTKVFNSYPNLSIEEIEYLLLMSRDINNSISLSIFDKLATNYTVKNLSKKKDDKSSLSFKTFSLTVNSDNEMSYLGYNYIPIDISRIMSKSLNEFPDLSMKEIESLLTLSRDESNRIIISVFLNLAKNYQSGELDSSLYLLESIRLDKAKKGS